MISYSNSIVIMAPVSEVFAYVNDLGTMADWITGLAEVSDVIGSGEGQQCSWVFRLAGVRLHGEAVVVKCVEDECCSHQAIGMFNSTWTNIVAPHDDGTTLSIDVEYELPIPVVGKFGERLTVGRMSRNLDSSLANIKDILEG